MVGRGALSLIPIRAVGDRSVSDSEAFALQNDRTPNKSEQFLHSSFLKILKKLFLKKFLERVQGRALQNTSVQDAVLRKGDIMNKIGFIGGGNMGGALACAATKTVGAQNVLVVDRDEASTAACAARIGATASSYEVIARECRLIFLAVKPNLVATVAAQLAPLVSGREDVALVSMAAGVPLLTLGTLFGDAAHIIRIMPNTPAAVGEGMIVYACSEQVTEQDKEVFTAAMSEAGRLDAIDECKIDAATGVMGCGPAYAYQFIEALADGGVACGLTRAQAQLYAAQTLLGAAEMVLSTGKHPGELKDAVCSPGGSTIQGVRTLEEGGLRGIVMDAVIAAYDKTKELGK